MSNRLDLSRLDVSQNIYISLLYMIHVRMYERTCTVNPVCEPCAFPRTVTSLLLSSQTHHAALCWQKTKPNSVLGLNNKREKNKSTVQLFKAPTAQRHQFEWRQGKAHPAEPVRHKCVIRNVKGVVLLAKGYLVKNRKAHHDKSLARLLRR